MKLEDQVCSLELSKQLKELGIKQDSLWWWNNQGLGHGHIGHYRLDMSEFSMFTVAELGEMLPMFFGSREYSKNLWECQQYECHGSNVTWNKTEANARAKMLIYLIENKFIEITP